MKKTNSRGSNARRLIGASLAGTLIGATAMAGILCPQETSVQRGLPEYHNMTCVTGAPETLYTKESGGFRGEPLNTETAFNIRADFRSPPTETFYASDRSREDIEQFLDDNPVVTACGTMDGNYLRANVIFPGTQDL